MEPRKKGKAPRIVVIFGQFEKPKTTEALVAHYSSILNQLLNLISRQEFQRIVDTHQGDKRVRSFSCWRQFVCLFFGQLTGQHTLRDQVLDP